MVNRSKSVGTQAESAVVKYLRTHGWPYAERRALAGAQDLGDITGTPGVCWEIKSGKAAEKAGDGLIADWLDETETERRHSAADIGVLVTKRAGYGPERAGHWLAHLDLMSLYALTGARTPLSPTIIGEPVHLHLATLLPILWVAGYGTAPAERAA